MHCAHGFPHHATRVPRGIGQIFLACTKSPFSSVRELLFTRNAPIIRTAAPTTRAISVNPISGIEGGRAETSTLRVCKRGERCHKNQVGFKREHSLFHTQPTQRPSWVRRPEERKYFLFLFESNPVFLGTAEEGKQPEEQNGKEMEQPDDDLGPPDLKVM